MHLLLFSNADENYLEVSSLSIILRVRADLYLFIGFCNDWNLLSCSSTGPELDYSIFIRCWFCWQ